MTKIQVAAFVMAQATACQCELQAMLIANKERENQGYAPAYGVDAFLELPERFGLHHNVVVDLMHTATED